jgi:hypothetical protein
MKTQTEVRNSFWESFPEFKSERRSKKRQNDYKTDIRVSFCDHVENLRRNGEITESLAQRVTL